MKIRRLLFQTWRVLCWVLLALVLLVLCLIAAVWWVNRSDDPLLPQVAQARRFEPPSPEAMRDNGYFILLGLGAPPSEDALAVGQCIFTAQMRNYERFQRTGNFDSRSANDACPYQQRIDITPLRCNAEADDCYAYYLQHAPAIRSKLSELAPFVARYLSLQDTPSYEEVVPPYADTAWTPIIDAIMVSELIDMRTALLLGEQHVDEALALLETNARIHRRMMEGSRTLFGGSMIALTLDGLQQQLISNALRHVPALTTDVHAQRLDAILQATPVPLVGVLESSTREMLNLLPSENRTRKFAFGYLPHATANAVYLNWQEAIRLARLPADQFPAQAALFGQTPAATSKNRWPLPFPFPSTVRNFRGNTLSGMLRELVSPSNYLDSIYHAHDIEGYHRLIRLQLAALRERVPPAQMPAWLAAQPPALRDPYTLQPMGWDAATQSLVFEGRQRQTQNPKPYNVYRVKLTPVAPYSISRPKIK